MVLNFFLMIVVLVGARRRRGVLFRQGSASPSRVRSPSRPACSSQRGADLDSIAAQLERHNVIDSALVFTTAVRFYYEAEDKLKAGEYLFQADVSMEQVLDDLLSGPLGPACDHLSGRADQPGRSSTG